MVPRHPPHRTAAPAADGAAGRDRARVDRRLAAGVLLAVLGSFASLATSQERASGAPRLTPAAGTSHATTAPAPDLALAQKPPPKAGDKPGDKKKDAKNAPPPLAPFPGKLALAKERAQARNVPILVHVVLDGESASEEYKKRVLTDADLLRASQGVIVIVADHATHAKTQVTETKDGVATTRDACSMFPMFASCGGHQAAWDELYQILMDEQGDMSCPQTVVIAPDGTIAARENTRDVPAPSAIVAALATVAAKAGPGLSEEVLAEVTKLLDSGRVLVGSKSWPEAWSTYTRVLELAPKGRWADEANRALPQVTAGVTAALDAIAARLVPGTAVKAYQELQAFQKSVAGTPFEKDAAARLKKADADKAIAPELAAWRLSNEADALLAEARDLYEQKNAAKGERVVRKLLGKRFASTPAAATARTLWPEIAADEDAKNR